MRAPLSWRRVARAPLPVALDVIADQDPDEVRRLAREAIARVDDGSGVLVLTDIIGATPCNCTLQLCVPGKVEVVAGVSLPMLLDDREVDFVTAMLTSVALVRENPVIMLGWGAFIAVLLFLGMLPGFLGLFAVLPVLGHASWHLYRRAVVWA